MMAGGRRVGVMPEQPAAQVAETFEDALCLQGLYDLQKLFSLTFNNFQYHPPSLVCNMGSALSSQFAFVVVIEHQVRNEVHQGAPLQTDSEHCAIL